MQPLRMVRPAVWLLLLSLPMACGQGRAAGAADGGYSARELRRLPGQQPLSPPLRRLPSEDNGTPRRIPFQGDGVYPQTLSAAPYLRDLGDPPSVRRLPNVAQPRTFARLPSVRLPWVGHEDLPDMEMYFADRICRTPEVCSCSPERCNMTWASSTTGSTWKAPSCCRRASSPRGDCGDAIFWCP